MSADTYGKDNKPKITNMGAKWPTLGNIATSSFTPEESLILDFGYQMIM